MASSSDSGPPWAELEAVYELVYKCSDIDTAIRHVVDRYTGAALTRLYNVTLHWGPTFVKRVYDEERVKRSKLTTYILRRGTASKRGK